MGRIKSTGLTDALRAQFARNQADLYLDIDEALLRDSTESDPVGAAIAAGTYLGITDGGVNIQNGPQMGTLNGDGISENDKGSQFLTDFEAMIEADLVTISQTVLLLLYNNATATDLGNGLTVIETDMQGTDALTYGTNMAAVVDYGLEATDKMVLLLRNTITESGIDLQTAHRESATLPLSVRGTFDYETPTLPPMSIFTPSAV